MPTPADLAAPAPQMSGGLASRLAAWWGASPEAAATMQAGSLLFMAVYTAHWVLRAAPGAQSNGALPVLARGPLWLGALIGLRRVLRGGRMLGWAAGAAAAVGGMVPPLAALLLVGALPALLGPLSVRALRAGSLRGVVALMRSLMHSVLLLVFAGAVAHADCAVLAGLARTASSWVLRFMRYTILD